MRFGKDAEAPILGDLVQPAGKDNVLLSHDSQTSRAAERVGHTVQGPGPMQHLANCILAAVAQNCYSTTTTTPRHKILRGILERLASNNRAQGSRALQTSRLKPPGRLGVPTDLPKRVYGHVGLIPSSRDPLPLAICVFSRLVMAAGNQVFAGFS